MVPRWKKWLSYLTEIHIESLPSKLSPHLYVSLNKGRFQLSTANAIYSFEDLYDNFKRAFDKIDLHKQPIKKVLVLGGGLLSVPILLEKHLSDLQHTVVEYDENVALLASKYALPKIKGTIHTVIGDAATYMDLCLEKFDLIAIDVFDDDKIPSTIQTMDFLDALDEALNPKGLILYNRLSKSQKDLQDTMNYYEQVFSPRFNEASYLDVDGNWVLINDRKYLKG